MQMRQWPSIREENEILIQPVIVLDPNPEYILGLTKKHKGCSYNIVPLKDSDKSVLIQVVT